MYLHWRINIVWFKLKTQISMFFSVREMCKSRCKPCPLSKYPLQLSIGWPRTVLTLFSKSGGFLAVSGLGSYLNSLGFTWSDILYFWAPQLAFFSKLRTRQAFNNFLRCFRTHCLPRSLPEQSRTAICTFSWWVVSSE